MTQKRNLGLDIIRVIAAILVIICHSGFFSVGISFPFLSFAGILAVEIFFVLSGLCKKTSPAWSQIRRVRKSYVTKVPSTIVHNPQGFVKGKFEAGSFSFSGR